MEEIESIKALINRMNALMSRGRKPAEFQLIDIDSLIKEMEFRLPKKKKTRFFTGATEQAQKQLKHGPKKGY